jgi:hypothetical protein
MPAAASMRAAIAFLFASSKTRESRRSTSLQADTSIVIRGFSGTVVGSTAVGPRRIAASLFELSD